jgi:uncharacterized protein
MPRPPKPRWIGFDPADISFVPQPGPPPAPGGVFLTVDELEALRLADLVSLSHELAAAEMNVSRATFGRIVARARAKTADALVNGRSIGIQGGVVKYHPSAHGGPHGRGGPRGHGPHGRGPGPHRGPGADVNSKGGGGYRGDGGTRGRGRHGNRGGKG